MQSLAHRRHQPVGRVAGQAGQLVGQPVMEVGVVRAARLGQPVGVQEQHVAGVQGQFLGGRLGVGKQPKREAAAVEHPHPAVRAEQHRRRVARAGHDRPQPALLPAQVGQTGRDEAAVQSQLVGQDDLVGAGQHLGRIGAPACQHADRVPGRRGHRGGLLALPAHVAHGQAPAAGGLVNVVEVAAHIRALGRGQVGRRELHAGDLRHPPQQQAGLQRVGGVRAPTEDPAGPDGQGHLLAERLDQPQLGHREPAVLGPPEQGQHAVPGLAVRQRNGQHRRGVQRGQQRLSVQPGPEDPGVFDVGDHHWVGGFVHPRRDRPGRRVDRRDQASLAGQPRLVRADGKLAP